MSESSHIVNNSFVQENIISPLSVLQKSNRKEMNKNWSNQKAKPAFKTKTGNKLILQIDKIQ